MLQSQIPEQLNLEILLPYRVFAKKTSITRVVAETTMGSMGILPHRMDCVAALVPGILVFENAQDGEVFLAVDQGSLVKVGFDIKISVRNAIGGLNLSDLHHKVETEFINLDENETLARASIERMESGFIHRLAELQNGR